MVKVEKSIIIKAPPKKIWELLALDKLPKWMFFENVSYTTEVGDPEDKYRVGATALGTPKGGPPDNCHFEIKEVLENEKITYRLWEKVYRGISGGLLTSTLEPIGAGTRFTYELDFNEIPWGIFGKLISPLLIRMGRKDFENSLENLKNIFEK